MLRAGDYTSKSEAKREFMKSVEDIRSDFPILHQQVHGKPLVYLDNAATSQVPKSVLQAMQHFYTHDKANVHRGVHELSVRATKSFEAVRLKAQKLLGALDPCEIVFVRGATEGINLVAQGYGAKFVTAGDEILVSAMEHHSNIVPWQMLCEKTGATLKVVPMNDAGELLLDDYDQILSKKTKIVAIGHISNALGTINPIKAMVEKAHAVGAVVLVDGAQAVPHTAVDVRDLGCDFYVLSAHKAYGPTGIGVLYGKRELLESMDPYQGGGDMIASVTFEKTTYSKVPYKFEAGTPNIADVIGMGAAFDYILDIGYERIAQIEQELLHYGEENLRQVPGIRFIGTAKQKASVLSFLLEGLHPHDIGTILDQEGVAIRAGHHCAQPVMQHFGVPATARASFAFYNTTDEIDRLVAALHKAREVFGL